jgi:hypothetical protein
MLNTMKSPVERLPATEVQNCLSEIQAYQTNSPSETVYKLTLMAIVTELNKGRSSSFPALIKSILTGKLPQLGGSRRQSPDISNLARQAQKKESA